MTESTGQEEKRDYTKMAKGIGDEALKAVRDVVCVAVGVALYAWISALGTKNETPQA